MYPNTDAGLRSVWLAKAYQVKLTPMDAHTLHVEVFSPGAQAQFTRRRRLGGSITHASQGKLHPTSVVLKTATDARRQHLAIAKLVRMCKASPVVANASRGITAEVRRDRDRGHE